MIARTLWMPLVLGLFACRATDAGSTDTHKSDTPVAKTTPASFRSGGIGGGSAGGGANWGYVRARGDGPPIIFYLEPGGSTHWHQPTESESIGDCVMEPGVKYRIEFSAAVDGRVTVTITNLTDGTECVTEVDVIMLAYASESSGGSWGHVRARGDGATIHIPVEEDEDTTDFLQPDEDVTIGDCVLQAGVKYKITIKWIGPWRVTVTITNTADPTDKCTTIVDVIPFGGEGLSPRGGRDGQWGYIRVESEDAPVAFMVNRGAGMSRERALLGRAGSLGDCALEPGVDYRFDITWISRTRVSVTVTSLSNPRESCTTEVDVTPIGTPPSNGYGESSSSGRLFSRRTGEAPVLRYYVNQETGSSVKLVLRPELDVVLGDRELLAGGCYLVRTRWDANGAPVTSVELLGSERQACSATAQVEPDVRAIGGGVVAFYTQPPEQDTVSLHVLTGRASARLELAVSDKAKVPMD